METRFVVYTNVSVYQIIKNMIMHGLKHVVDLF